MTPSSFFVFGIIVGCANVHGGQVSQSLSNKLKTSNADVVLELPSVMQQVLSNPILNMLSGNSQASMMTSLLKSATASLQAPFTNALNSFGIQSTPFWISNKIFIKNADPNIINMLTALPGTFTLREPFKVKLVEPVNKTYSAKADTIQWGVKKIGANALWSRSNGNDILVANIDTDEVDADHEALSSNYAGFWHDSIDGQETPYDDNGHGTHTMGTICGTKNGIGVAPGARWVACKGLGEQGGSDVTLSECAQWILNLKQKPVVVCNSWGGGQGDSFFNDEIAAWQKAGIIPVFAIGNEGPKCGTSGSPGDQSNLISVGATDQNDKMARFSSRGPARRSGIMKPEVTGPGVGILSAKPGGGYQTMSGTSMATPHVAGAIALMKSINPSLTFKQILDRLEKTAERPSNVDSADLKCCGTKGDSKFPNCAYGFGRIDVVKAIK